VNGHSAANIHRVENFSYENSVQREEYRLECGEHHLLREGSLAEDCAHRNEEGTSTEFTFASGHGSNVDLFIETLNEKAPEEALEEDAKLEGPGGAHKVHGDGGPRVSFEENHEESKAHKNHDMNIHEHAVKLGALISCHSVHLLNCEGVVGMCSHTIIKIAASDEQNDHNNLGE